MTTMETAKASAKLLGLRTPSEVKQGKDAGLSKLAKEIGKSDQYLYDHLKLLEENQEVQEYLENPESNIRMSLSSPTPHRVSIITHQHPTF